MQAVTMLPPMVALFHLLQFLPLFVREIGSYLLVRFHPDRANSTTGVAPYLL